MTKALGRSCKESVPRVIAAPTPSSSFPHPSSNNARMQLEALKKQLGQHCSDDAETANSADGPHSATKRCFKVNFYHFLHPRIKMKIASPPVLANEAEIILSFIQQLVGPLSQLAKLCHPAVATQLVLPRRLTSLQKFKKTCKLFQTCPNAIYCDFSCEPCLWGQTGCQSFKMQQLSYQVKFRSPNSILRIFKMWKEHRCGEGRCERVWMEKKVGLWKKFRYVRE